MSLSVKFRIGVEQAIALRLINDALGYGYKLAVDNGETISKPSADADVVFKKMFETDEDRLIFYKEGKNEGWVFFVYGNDGPDVINDYTTNLEAVLKGANELGEKIDELTSDDGYNRKGAATVTEVGDKIVFTFG